MSSTAPFGVTVWGWGSGATGGYDLEHPGIYTSATSYGFPAGQLFKPITDVVIDPTK
jgi:hypothetical protein